MPASAVEASEVVQYVPVPADLDEMVSADRGAPAYRHSVVALEGREQVEEHSAACRRLVCPTLAVRHSCSKFSAGLACDLVDCYSGSGACKFQASRHLNDGRGDRYPECRTSEHSDASRVEYRLVRDRRCTSRGVCYRSGY